MKTLPLVILLSLLLWACEDACVSKALDEADSHLFKRPDTTAMKLDSLDLSGATAAQRARHALLLTKARAKAGLAITDTSLIALASDHYRDRGDSLEVQSLFFHGLSLKEFNNYSEALVVLECALDKALKTEDNFYAAMSSRNIAEIFKNYLNYTNAEQYAAKASLHFVLAAKPTHATWESLTQAYCQAKLQQFGKAKELLDSVREYVFKETDPDLITEWYRVSAQTYIGLEDYDAAYGEMRALATATGSLCSYDCFLTGVSLCGLDRYREAETYRDVINQNRKTISDSLAELYLSYLIERKAGDSLLSYQYFHQYQNLSIPKLTYLLTHSCQDSLIVHYDKRLNDAADNGSNISILLAIIILSIIILWVFFKYNNKRRQLLHLTTEMTRLEERLKSVLLNNQAEEQEIEDSNSGVENLITMFDNMCSKIFYLPETIKSSKFAQNWFEGENIEVFDVLEKAINTVKPGLMQSFRQDYPRLKVEYYNVALLVFLHFSIEGACGLLGYNRKNNFATIKSRLKKQLQDNPCTSTGTYLEYFSK